MVETQRIGEVGFGYETERVAPLPAPILRGDFVGYAPAEAKIGVCAVEAAECGTGAEGEREGEGAQQGGVGVGCEREDDVAVAGGDGVERGGVRTEQTRGGAAVEADGDEIGFHACGFVLEAGNEEWEQEEQTGEETEGGHEERNDTTGCDVCATPSLGVKKGEREGERERPFRPADQSESLSP